MPSVILHVSNEEPVIGEVDELPKMDDMMIQLKNPRRRDGKDLHYLEANISVVIWPIHRVNFIEIIPSGEEDDIISFVRE